MKNLVQSKCYQKAVQEIKGKTNIGVDADYDDVLAELDNNRVAKAGVEVSDIVELLDSDYIQIVNFAIGKLVKFHNAKIDEEYPKGEEVEKEDCNEVHGNYVISFLLMYLLEYYFLKNNPSELESYLKAIRVPNAKKYSRELNKIYSNLK